MRVLPILVGAAGWAVIFSSGVPSWKVAIAAVLFIASDLIRDRIDG